MVPSILLSEKSEAVGGHINLFSRRILFQNLPPFCCQTIRNCRQRLLRPIGRFGDTSGHFGHLLFRLFIVRRLLVDRIIIGWLRGGLYRGIECSFLVCGLRFGSWAGMLGDLPGGLRLLSGLFCFRLCSRLLSSCAGSFLLRSKFVCH